MRVNCSTADANDTLLTITCIYKNKYEILQSKRRGEPPYSSILTDRQTDNGRTCKYRDPKK